MTEAELTELLRDCPTLYHMAERQSWPSIRRHGLLSTAALLDQYGVTGRERRAIELARRPASVALEKRGLPGAVVRDQLPMDDKGLLRCLQDGLTPTDWYRVLNSRVFFWLSRERLVRLLRAGSYRDQEHDVLELDTSALVHAHRSAIWLCPMNSGCTKPVPHPRGVATFRRIADYPYSTWRKKRKRGERVVELAVDHAVDDVVRFVRRVVRMRGDEERELLFERRP